MKTYEHIVSFALDHPWAITRPMLGTIASIIARHVAGETIAPEDIQAAIKSRKELPQPRAGTVGILPVYGIIAPRANTMTEMSGGTSVEALSVQLPEFI